MTDDTGIEPELLDYDEIENEAAGDQQNDTNQGAEEPKKEVKAKGAYTSIHSSGFRDFLLKPELMRAIQDCGFEHPSEGTANRNICRLRVLLFCFAIQCSTSAYHRAFWVWM